MKCRMFFFILFKKLMNSQTYYKSTRMSNSNHLPIFLNGEYFIDELVSANQYWIIRVFFFLQPYYRFPIIITLDLCQTPPIFYTLYLEKPFEQSIPDAIT